jgi:hypothetical protein
MGLTSSNDSTEAEDSEKGTEAAYSGWAFRLLQVIFRVILYLPWIWIALFALFILLVTIQVGRLPAYGQPDPKDAGSISILYTPVIVTLLLVMGSSPIGIGLAIVKLLRDVPNFIRRGEAILYLVGIALFFIFITSDVAGLMTWLGD